MTALKLRNVLLLSSVSELLNTRNRTHSAGHTAHSIRIPLTRTELTSVRFLHSIGIIIRVHQKETLRNEMWLKIKSQNTILMVMCGDGVKQMEQNTGKAHLL